MAKTKAEIIKFMDSQVGKKVNAKCGIYNGQCVSLIKALLEFVGAPDPYKARGNATDVGNTLIREGIAKNGKGWLTIVINHDMGRIYENGRWNNYGHIWIDLKSVANYEQNGAKALYTTKNTRPISQGQQFVNIDKYIKEDIVKPTKSEVGNMFNQAGIADDKVTAKQYAYYMARDWKVLAQDVAPMIRKLYTDKRAQLAEANKRIDELEKQVSSEFVSVGQLYIKKES